MSAVPVPNVMRNRNLWWMTVGPTVWAAHFLVAYAGAAIFCAKWRPPDGSLGTAQLYVLAITVPALAVIALSGGWAYRRWGFAEGAKPPHDADTTEDRERFLGLSTLLLSGLSFVATVYTALPALLAASCR